MTAPMSQNEAARLEALHAYAILDTPAEAAFDDLVRLAALICQTPMATISLVDSDRQWFKSRLGVKVSATPREESFCSHAITHPDDLFIVPDATLDERFAGLALVREAPHIRFYAGARLLDAEGHALGMLCVLDRTPRTLEEAQKESLRMLARQVMSQLELHRELAAHQASRHLLEYSQDELRASKALYQSLVEHVPLLILRKDKEGRFTFGNQLICDALHCQPGDLEGKTDFDFLPTELAQKFRANDEWVLATGEVVETIEELPRPGEASIHAQIITSPLRDQDGNITGVQVISRDVTERHLLELQLRKAHDGLEQRVRTRTTELEAANCLLQQAELQASEWKNRYDLIVSLSGLAIYDIDRLRGEVIWDSGAERLLGHPPGALNRARNDWLALVHPQDQEETMHEIEAALAAGTSFEVQYRLRHAAGHYLWIEDRGFLVRDPQGRCVRMLGLIGDVTQRKLAEDKMREQAALLDKTQDAIMVRSLDNLVLYWNKTAERLYGWTAAEALGQPIQDLLLGGQLAHLPTARAAAIKDGEWQDEIKVKTKMGRELLIHSRWTLLRDRDGRPHSFLIAHTDQTERKMLEEKFLRAQRLESIGALASGIAHDLNNVFTPILMTAQLLRDDTDEASRAPMLELLQSSALRGSEMVKQVLTFARGPEAGLGLVQAKHLIRELEKMMRDTFPREISIELNLSTDLRPVRGDATQLYQVLMNLCINARDAMPGGGILRVEATNRDHPHGASDASGEHPPSAEVCIIVADNGTGMPPEVKRRIFEPFFTTKEPGKGTGLGLSTVMTIVKSHRGSVEVESEPGVGTTFRVLLPAERATSAELAAVKTEAPRGHGELLLVVDDESSIREIVKTALEAHDYDVLLAEEGTEALALYAAHRDKIALVITDMAMPVLDGQATIRALRKMNPHVKLIAVSGLKENHKLEQLANEGGVTVLAKPYSPHQLLNAIHTSLHPVQCLPAAAAVMRQ